ncbi:MAG TPA: DUF2188 domain-containing protein [Xanthobacteraceae bacterium]|jgi:hypothetical protein
MHKPRYVVVNQEGEWRIKQAGRHLSASYTSKTQALSAAIEFAEKDGHQGRVAEVIVRHEDEHFVTEWVFGQNVQPGTTAPPLVTPHHADPPRSGRR